jgi:hypothetical protein
MTPNLAVPGLIEEVVEKPKQGRGGGITIVRTPVAISNSDAATDIVKAMNANIPAAVKKLNGKYAFRTLTVITDAESYAKAQEAQRKATAEATATAALAGASKKIDDNTRTLLQSMTAEQIKALLLAKPAEVAAKPAAKTA